MYTSLFMTLKFFISLNEMSLARVTQCENKTSTADPLTKLDRFEGYVVSHVTHDSFILKGMDQNFVTWHCLVSLDFYLERIVLNQIEASWHHVLKQQIAIQSNRRRDKK